MLCVLILYISDETYSLKSTPDDRVFEKQFMAILEKWKYFLYFVLMSGLGLDIWLYV